MRYEEVDFIRDCDVVQIPQGILVTVEAATPALVMQTLDDSFTVQIPTLGGLYRLAAKDADAIGKEPPHVAHDADVSAGPIDEARVRHALKNVYDPEIPVNIIDLGLVYDLSIEPLAAGGSKVCIRMTLTASGCGMGQIIADDVKRRLAHLPGVTAADVEIVWEPPWTPDQISPAGRTKLGLD